jgi:hypothetical protein
MVNSDLIRMFMTPMGVIIGEQFGYTDTVVKLSHPFRLIPNDKGTVSVAPMFIKEEWVNIPLTNIEVQVADGLKDLYIKYEADVFRSIIAPTSADMAKVKG